MPTQTSDITVTIPLKDLEKLIRRAVRDEIAKLIILRPDIFNLEPEMPIYDDMVEIAKLKKQGKIKVYSRQEAFSD